MGQRILKIFLWTSLLAAMLIAPRIRAQTAVSLEQRVTIASGLYADIQLYFAHWNSVPTYDLKSAYQNYLQQILSSDDRRAFDMDTIQFVAGLHNGHSRFVDTWLVDTDGQGLNFYAQPLDGRWTVTESRVPGLTPGMILTAIDDQPLADFYQSQRVYLPASSDRARARKLFATPYLFAERFTLTTDAGRHIMVRRSGSPEFTPFSDAQVTVTEHAGVLIIKIPGFSPDHLETDAIAALGKAQGYRAVVFDLRGNYGGNTPGQLLAALMDRPYRLWTESSAQHIGALALEDPSPTHMMLKSDSGVQQPSAPVYSGPVFLLVDGGCVSACEDFVLPFKDNHRGVILGEPTAGSSGTPYHVTVGNGMSYFIGAKLDEMPDGAPFEGVGIRPDVAVAPHASDLVKGRDPVLERVLDFVLFQKPLHAARGAPHPADGNLLLGTR